MSKHWNSEEILNLAKSYQSVCVLAAAADLDLFSILAQHETTAPSLATTLSTDPRATTVLLDALTAMELLEKRGNAYRVPPAITDLLTNTSSCTVLSMVQHQANCLRRWVQLPQVIQSGNPAERHPSLRGEAADQGAFINAMHAFSEPVADSVVAETGPWSFNHLLDLGGASGTWTIAFLQAVPDAIATIFDLPDVIPMAREHIAQANLSARVRFVAGDFYTDDLPSGTDFVWLGAIAHQNSREQNRELLTKIHGVLNEHGVLAIRDVVMDDTHTRPLAGAMFAVNMLVATQAGGTYTLSEYREDLLATRFANVTLIRSDEFMNSIIRATKA